MKERKEVVSKNLVENVLPTLGTNSKKPNAVVMAVNEDFIIDALGLYKDKKKGIERETGLVRLELVAVYVEEETFIEPLAESSTEKKIESMNNDLDEVLEDN